MQTLLESGCFEGILPVLEAFPEQGLNLLDWGFHSLASLTFWPKGVIQLK